MDLKAILAANKVKTEQSNLTRKPVDIANQDRPYSLDDIVVPSFIGTENTSKPTTNWENSNTETGNKLATNWQQTGNKLATEPTTNWQQTGNKVEPQTQNWQQSGNQTGNTFGNKVATNRQQTGNKLATKTSFSELVGLQRDIIIFICHECKNSRSRTTESLTLEHIAKSLKRNAGAVKTTLQRLEKKHCIVRVEFKNGRGGWSRYEVPDGIYHDVLRNETGNKVTTNRQQTDNKVASQPTTEPATSASSSSSLNIKETTTTSDLPNEWKFDIAPYARFGFTISQTKQLASLGVITATDVEQSLIEFSYDLDNSALLPIKTTKINFLMGLLRAGHSYVSEGFKNEQESMIAEMARRASAKRESALKAKFEAWEASASANERKQIENSMPTHLMVLQRAHGISNPEVRDWLFNYYLQLDPSE